MENNPNTPAEAQPQSPAPSPAAAASYWREAMGLIRGTMPMVGVTIGVYAIFFLATVIWFGVWGGLAYLLSGVPILSVICVVIALGIGGGVVWFARRYFLYLVKGAHIAAMTELLQGRQLPAGFAQLSYGREIIQKYFRDVSLLFGLDMLIDATLKAISRTIIRISSMLPLPQQATGVVKLATEILNRSLSYIDEAILSYAIAKEEENVWNSARHGIVLYGQSYKPILITAAKVWLLGKISLFAVFILLMIPVGGLMFAVEMSGWVQVFLVLGTLVAAWAIELALFEPFALAYVMTTYHREIAGKTPDPEWDARLQSVSKSFQQIVAKAKEKMASAPEQTSGPGAPGEAPAPAQPAPAQPAPAQTAPPAGDAAPAQAGPAQPSAAQTLPAPGDAGPPQTPSPSVEQPPTDKPPSPQGSS